MPDHRFLTDEIIEIKISEADAEQSWRLKQSMSRCLVLGILGALVTCVTV